jgi:hypothetical protein
MAKIPYRPLRNLHHASFSLALLIRVCMREHVLLCPTTVPPPIPLSHIHARSCISDTLTTSHHSIWLPGSVRSHMLVAAHLTQLCSSHNHACSGLVTALAALRPGFLMYSAANYMWMSEINTPWQNMVTTLRLATIQSCVAALHLHHVASRMSAFVGA